MGEIGVAVIGVVVVLGLGKKVPKQGFLLGRILYTPVTLPAGFR